MNFAAPLFLGLGALAAPVVVLYILKVRRRRARVPYLRLWADLVVETKARSLFRRLKRLYSLLLQLLILASLVMAVAQPAFDLASVKKESVVLLLDCSASMNAVEGDEGEARHTRWERAMERARRYVEERSYEDEMLIAAASDRVDVLCSFNRNTIRLREALEKARPTERPLDVERALAFAREVTANREHPVVLFLSDGGAGAVRDACAADEHATLVTIGETTDNVGILRFAARKNTSLGTDYLLAVVKNHGEEPVETRLELTRDGSAIAVDPITLPPGEEVRWTKSLTIDQGGTLRLEVVGDDALAQDDVAYAVVRPVRLRKVGLVVEDEDDAAPFLIAFQSMVEVVSGDSFFTTVEQYPTMTEERRRADVTICLGAVPEGLPPRGNLILMDTPVPAFVPARETGRDEQPTVWDWDREHVLNRYLNYRDLPIPPARTIDPTGDAESLVSGFDGPLVAAFDLPERRVVYVAFDMTAELFPFRLAFPMLLRNAIAWFEVEEDVVLEATYPPGATITPLRRLGEKTVKATFLRDGEPVERELEVREGRFYFAETDEPGAIVFDVGGRNHATAINLFDAHESAIAPTPPEAADEDAGASADRHLFNRDLWALLAALGLALWSLEWLTYHRRITE